MSVDHDIEMIKFILLSFFLRPLGNKLRYLTSQIRQLAQDYVVNNGSSQDSNLGSTNFGKELGAHNCCVLYPILPLSPPLIDMP